MINTKSNGGNLMQPLDHPGATPEFPPASQSNDERRGQRNGWDSSFDTRSLDQRRAEAEERRGQP